MLQVSLLEQTFLGRTFWQFLLFFASIILGFILGKISAFIFQKYMASIARQTKTNIDDLVLMVLKKPLVFIFVILSIFFGFQFLEITNPLIIQTFNNIINILVLLLVAWLFIRFVDALVLFYLKPFAEKTESALDDQLIPVVRKVTKIGILLIFLVIILSSFGYDVTALLAGLGIGGLAIAFAAQETIADVFGGVSLFTSRPFLVGDYVQAASIEGTVTEIGLRFTRIRDPQNKLITIPNSKIAKEVIINYSNAVPRGIDLTLSLTYQTTPEQLKKAIQIVKDIISSHPDCTTEPIIIFNNFGSSSLDLLVRYFIKNPVTPKDSKTPKVLKVKNEINMRILEEFNKAGLAFAYPTQTIFLKK